MKQKPWSKLKNELEKLFDPALDIRMECNAFSMPGGRSIPRFYLRMENQIVWDFPSQFEIKNLDYGYWADRNEISSLIRDYIDTPPSELMTRQFEKETRDFLAGLLPNDEQKFSVSYNLTELFIAADRRIGRQKLIEFAEIRKNPLIDQIISKRFSLHGKRLKSEKT